METTLPPSRPLAPKDTTSWGSILQLAFSLIGAAGLLITAGLVLLSGLVVLLNPAAGSPTPAAMMGMGLAGTGLLVLPSAWYAWRRIMGQPPTRVRPINPWLLTLITAVILPVVFLTGHLLAENTQIGWLIMPLLNLIGVGLPILWLLQIGIRKLSGGSAQRQWGIFATGLTLTPLLIITVEITAFLLFGFVALVWIISQPGLEQELLLLLQRLRFAPPTEEAYLNILGPYLSRPGVILGIFFGISFIAPLVEETLKPLALWFLAGRKLTPTQGYVAGMISGAAFALFENLSSTSGGGPDWAITAAGRIATALLHILASGLVGFGLASAWKKKEYLRLGLAFGLAVTIHGLWNSLAVLSFLGVGLGTFSFPAPLPQWGTGAIFGLVLLALLNLVMLLGFPRILARQPARQSQALPPAAPLTQPTQTEDQ